MNDIPIVPQEPAEEPANLKLLRRLVTGLLATMIVGVVVVVGLLVMRITAEPAPMALPDNITLPEGVNAAVFTMGTGWFAVVTRGNEILIYDQVSGKLRQTIQMD